MGAVPVRRAIEANHYKIRECIMKTTQCVTETEPGHCVICLSDVLHLIFQSCRFLHTCRGAELLID